MTDNTRELGGCVLLSDYAYDLEAFRVQFYDDWKIEIDAEPEAYHYEFDMGEAHIAILVAAMKNKDAAAGCPMNYEWEGSAEAVASHKAQIKVAVLGCREPLRRYVLFTMIAASLMKQESAIGLYRYPTVYRPEDFIAQAEVLKKEDIPTNLWVYIGVHRDAAGLWNCYTYGMEDFGNEEMEILHTHAPLLDMYGFMQNLVKWLITSNGMLDDKQRLMLSATEGCEITRSDAVAYEGTTLKIGYRN